MQETEAVKKKKKKVPSCQFVLLLLDKWLKLATSCFIHSRIDSALSRKAEEVICKIEDN